MWNYEKRLQYPIHIKTPNAKIAKIILTQYGGPYTRNLEWFFYLFKCERDLIKKMMQYFSPAGNRGVFYCILIWIASSLLANPTVPATVPPLIHSDQPSFSI